MIKPLLATAALAISTSANAVTYEYGNLLSGNYAPAESFASLTVNNSGNVYDVTFNVFDLDAIFTQGAFIGAVAINNVPGNDFVPTISNISGDAPVAISPGVGPTPIYETRFDFTDPQSRLTANESVSFTATFTNTVEPDIANFAVHVQGLTEVQGGSAWYVASAVPEPETYAMLLAGLGLMGFMARRKASSVK
ncbi:PEP-CTERM protein-sorting domain-containing protein [Nitrosospira sp. Nl5]|uniref:FxDxF family PEP-CTERM protein n=1 Tax=Nitrosospira sp. Nl5 TaxID=200120 RepID=UPI0008813773|nr:FxDxF family PEP-CTERM protein [Nitrosospira sp. Nl5]SCY26640.1 PEP-CTERM protein-sorting domain-containing protein [Nitrosospira sp. Nl5]